MIYEKYDWLVSQNISLLYVLFRSVEMRTWSAHFNRLLPEDAITMSFHWLRKTIECAPLNRKIASPFWLADTTDCYSHSLQRHRKSASIPELLTTRSAKASFPVGLRLFNWVSVSISKFLPSLIPSRAISHKLAYNPHQSYVFSFLIPSNMKIFVDGINHTMELQ